LRAAGTRDDGTDDSRHVALYVRKLPIRHQRGNLALLSVLSRSLLAIDIDMHCL